MPLPEVAASPSRPGSAAASHLAALTASFERATRRAGLVERGMRVGPFGVRLRFAGDALLDGVLPALATLDDLPPAAPDATICLFDDDSTGVRAPEPPWRREDTRVRGDVLGYDDDRFGTVCINSEDPRDGDPRSLSMYDRRAREGVFWVRSPGGLAWWERAAPLRVLLHWALAGERRCLVHAAAVGDGHAGVLLAGASGAGKTTTTLACLDAGMRTAGDDFVLLDHASAHAIFRTAKVEPGSLALLPRLGALVERRELPGDEKLALDLHRTWPAARAESMPLHAIVMPVVTGGAATRIVPARRADALQALGSPTVLQLPRAGAALGAIAGLARAVPSYRLELGGDPAAAARAIAELLSTLRP